MEPTELQKLGKKINQLRVDHNKSLTDIAKVFQIDRTYISKIENGHERPTKLFLNHLISHFNLSSSDATELFTLAGYKDGTVATQTEKGKSPMTNDFKIPFPQESNKQMQVNMPVGLAVLYSDSIVINSNQWGVVFDFGQSMGPNPAQTNIVSRIGMSREHAKALLEALKKNIEATTVPEPKDKTLN
ncbi:DUF3467 domain-containing protein [Patescibacteria group bacterium]|nr:DUF3467 domain-containing protein [Patescibacteria group bacterium]